MWDELTILWNDLTILWNDPTIDWNDLTWNDLTMERNDRIATETRNAKRFLRTAVSRVFRKKILLKSITY